MPKRKTRTHKRKLQTIRKKKRIKFEPVPKCTYVVSEEERQVVLSNNKRVRKANITGKFSTLVNLIEQKGIQYISTDEFTKSINFKINNTNVIYIWSETYFSHIIFMYNELHEYIQGIIIVECMTFEIMYDIVSAANQIFELSNSEQTTNKRR